MFTDRAFSALPAQRQQPAIPGEEVTGLQTKMPAAAGVSRQRRALGDITNAGKDAKLKEMAKKAAALAPPPVGAGPVGVLGGFGQVGGGAAATASLVGTAASSMCVTADMAATTEGIVLDVEAEIEDAIVLSAEKGEESQGEAMDLDDCHMHVAEENNTLGGITQEMQGMTLRQPGQGLSLSQVDDIDALDRDQPAACVEYVEEQYKYYREKECRPGYDPCYMAKQRHISGRMRAMLIDWLVEVDYKFKGVPETLYLAVNILDRFLDRKLVPRDKLQLVGVTAYLIASKYEEIYPPEVKELVYMAGGALDRKQILDMESRMLAALKFNVTVCTAHCFLMRFLKAGHANDQLFFLASYICERTLLELDILHFLPSIVAASSVYLARKNLKARPWSPTLEHYTHYTEEMLLPCLRVMTPWISNRSQRLPAISNKYKSKRFMRVSQLELEGV